MENKIIFVAQDRGSGNALTPVIKNIIQEKKFSAKVYASENSKKIFQNSGIIFTDPEENLNKEFGDFKPRLIVTGSSMRRSIEKEAIKYAREHSIKSISVLDFWGNFWHKFTINGEKDQDSLPDHILIPDQIAMERMTDEGFPPIKLVITGNPYFDSFSFSDNKEDEKSKKKILFVSQPVYRNGKYLTNIRRIKDVIEVLKKIDYSLSLTVKPHPRERFNSFKEIIKNGEIDIYPGNDIKSVIKEFDIFIGTDSTVLFEAAFCGKHVISYQTDIKNKDSLITNALGISNLVRNKVDMERVLNKVIYKNFYRKEIPVIKYYNDGLCTKRVSSFIKKIF